MIGRARLRVGLPRLNGRIPVIRRAAGFVVEVPADPFRNLIMKTGGIKRAPVKQNDAAAAFHLASDDLQMIPDVERMILLLAVSSVGGQKNRVGVIERRSVLGPTLEMRLDADLAFQVG